jgi:putative transcriptional regulator
MSEYFDSLKRGLEEAVAYANGDIKARTFRVKFEPVPEYAPEDIKRIRTTAKMTQFGFAEFLGVSSKAVESWECGRNKPNGSARRLMSAAEADPAFPARYYSVTAKTGYYANSG